jgi:endoglucanase
MRKIVASQLSMAACSLFAITAAQAQALQLSPDQTLEGPGLSVIVEQNHFSPIFFDEKNAGIQIVMHGERIATDGEVRLNPTPEQWDPVPIFGERTLGEGPWPDRRAIELPRRQS